MSEIGMEDARQIEHLVRENAYYEEQLDLARKLINRAVEIMTVEQVSQWEGVRAWQEEFNGV